MLCENIVRLGAALQSHDLSGEGIEPWITYILFCPHKDMEGLPGWVICSMPGATSETAQTWKTIHTRHTLIHSNKANMKWWLWRPNDIRGPCGPKVSWHLSYRWGKLRKNIIQETCPDRSNPGPLGDRSACYRLFHSGGQHYFPNGVNLTNFDSMVISVELCICQCFTECWWDK